MPQLTEFTNLPNPPFNGTDGVFFNTTIRQTLHMSIGGDHIRIRFSNAFGPNSVTIDAATVALPLGGGSGASAIVPGSVKTLTFSGSPSFTIPNGAQIVSDPIAMPIQAQQTITVTMFTAAGQLGFDITSHPGSRATSWMAFGNHVSANNITDPSTQSLQHWYYVSAVETFTAAADPKAFVIVGDSITDGRETTTDGNNRWPDLVLARMQQNPALQQISVNNQAAGGNRILADGNGPNALGRIDRDVLAQTGVKYAMIFEGVNDIGVVAATTAAQQVIGDQVIAAFKQIITRVHAQGIPIFASTITPFGAPANDSSIQPYSSPIREVTRQRVNAFIRSGAFDAVIDFDKVVADPTTPSQLAPEFNSGDFLHPNVAGYTAMADAFPLDLFEQFAGGCRRRPPLDARIGSFVFVAVAPSNRRVHWLPSAHPSPLSPSPPLLDVSIGSRYPLFPASPLLLSTPSTRHTSARTPSIPAVVLVPPRYPLHDSAVPDATPPAKHNRDTSMYPLPTRATSISLPPAR
ncbi:SGNH hydrolase-type esterase domain-containing protein [Roridomyces roridus]|uniref:SGNH hydrolase-type esterase domain-containing protein n=1 Tax=Roridomyces roridus TaxID=1738132 RepID=A0AAD7FNU6_9AGAR|nr:SGNH hydrolase-type esterase domain-containing protein [Roridomyces roridus]